MALVSADRVRELTSTNGTGTLTLSGAAVGYQTFLSAIGNGNTCYYAIYNPGTNEWEVGIGTVGSGTLARTTVLKSSNSNTLVNFTAGTKDVFVTYPADTAVFNGGTPSFASVTASTVSSGQVNITGQGDLRLEDTTGGEYVALQAPGTLAASYTLTMPADDGTNGQALITDGSGNLSWSTAASGDVYGPASATDNAVTRFDLTTGKIIQNSGVIIDDSNNITGVAALTASGNVTLSGGTANGVTYLNGSKVLTSGSALTFDGTSFQNSNSIISGRSGGSDGSFTLKRASDGLTVGTLSVDSTNSLINLGTAYSYLTFSNYLGEQMRLTSTGLGIGTSSPGAKLDVTQSANSPIAKFNDTFNNKYLLIKGGGSPNRMVLDACEGGGGGAALDFASNGTTNMRLDSSGNLGLGVTPSAWGFGGNLQTAIGSYHAGGNYTYRTANVYYNAGEKYITTAAACKYSQYDGVHAWYTAPYGTAGSAISFTQAMTLDASSNLTVLGNGYFNGGVGGQGAYIFRDGSTGGGIYSSQVGNTVIQSGATGSGLGIVFQTGSGNAERMRIDSSGNVGIGTSSPATKLDVAGTGRVGSGFLATYIGTNSAFANEAEVYSVSTNPLNIGTAGSAPLRFWTNSAENMRLDSSGNLGLGVTPSAWDSSWKAVELAGGSLSADTGGTSLFAYQNTYFNGTSYIYKTTAAASYYKQNAGSHQWFTAPYGTAGNAISFTQAMTLDASGNLQIGTTGGAYRTAINFTGNAAFSNAQSDFVTMWQQGYANGLGVAMSSSDKVARLVTNNGYVQAFCGGSAEFMRIDSSGNLGIGSSVPTSKLQVVGLPVYANNTAAIAGGLTAGAFYRTGADPDPVCVVH